MACIFYVDVLSDDDFLQGFFDDIDEKFSDGIYRPFLIILILVFLAICHKLCHFFQIFLLDESRNYGLLLIFSIGEERSYIFTVAVIDIRRRGVIGGIIENSH